MGGEYVLFKKIDGGTTLGHFAYAGKEGGEDELCTMIGGFVGVPLYHKFFIMSLWLIHTTISRSIACYNLPTNGGIFP